MNSETTREMTTVELASIRGNTVDLFRQRYAQFRREGNPLFADKFSQNATLTVEQITMLTATKSGRSTSNKDHEIRSVKPIVPVGNQTARPNEDGPETGSDAVKLEREKAMAAAKWEFMKLSHKDRAKKSSEIYTVKKAPLWLTLALTAGASVPNMFQVTFAIKHDALVSCFLTGALTVAPFLLIMSKVRGFFPMGVVVSVMLYTGFCNATSIFGGLTALDTGYILKPTVFLEAVTNLLNTDYLNTARGLSGLMALLIGAIEFVSFKNIAK